MEIFAFLVASFSLCATAKNPLRYIFPKRYTNIYTNDHGHIWERKLWDREDVKWPDHLQTRPLDALYTLSYSISVLHGREDDWLPIYSVPFKPPEFKPTKRKKKKLPKIKPSSVASYSKLTVSFKRPGSKGKRKKKLKESSYYEPPNLPLESSLTTPSGQTFDPYAFYQPCDPSGSKNVWKFALFLPFLFIYQQLVSRFFNTPCAFTTTSFVDSNTFVTTTVLSTSAATLFTTSTSLSTSISTSSTTTTSLSTFLSSTTSTSSLSTTTTSTSTSSVTSIISTTSTSSSSTTTTTTSTSTTSTTTTSTSTSTSLTITATAASYWVVSLTLTSTLQTTVTSTPLTETSTTSTTSTETSISTSSSTTTTTILSTTLSTSLSSTTSTSTTSSSATSTVTSTTTSTSSSTLSSTITSTSSTITISSTTSTTTTQTISTQSKTSTTSITSTRTQTNLVICSPANAGQGGGNLQCFTTTTLALVRANNALHAELLDFLPNLLDNVPEQRKILDWTEGNEEEETNWDLSLFENREPWISSSIDI